MRFAILSSEQLSRLDPAKDDTTNCQSARQPLVAKELLYLKSIARSNLSDWLRQVETVGRIAKEDFCGTSKSARAVMAKEMLILMLSFAQRVVHHYDSLTCRLDWTLEQE